jgi:DNA-binding CsgD family transcriptional regulator
MNTTTSQDIEIAHAWIHFQREPADIELLARAVDAGCRFRLPNDSLNGLLSGHEPAIRQEACLMMLGGFLSRSKRLNEACASGDLGEISDRIGRTVSGSLRFAKRRIARERFRALRNISPLEEARLTHGSDRDCQGLDREERESLASSILELSIRKGKLSARNKKIARLIFDEGLSPRETAARLGVSPSAVHQQLRRITATLHAISYLVEVPRR